MPGLVAGMAFVQTCVILLAIAFSAPRHRQVTTLSLKIMRAARDAGDLPVSTA